MAPQHRSDSRGRSTRTLLQGPTRRAGPPRRVPRAHSSSRRAAPPLQAAPARHQPPPRRNHAKPGHGQAARRWKSCGQARPRCLEPAPPTASPRPTGLPAPPPGSESRRISWLSASACPGARAPPSPRAPSPRVPEVACSHPTSPSKALTCPPSFPDLCRVLPNPVR